MTNTKQELTNFLAQPAHKPCKATVLPDFFLDRLISLDWNHKEFARHIDRVATRKGGSIDGISQTDIRGGNAINVASALANLGATVTPIVCTSSYGMHQIEYSFRETPADFSHVKIRAKASVTTALEFKSQAEKTNVMIRDLGSLAEFSPEDLTEEDYASIEDGDYTCLFNWAGTLKHGTALAQAVFGRARRGRGKTYYDTADPSPNPCAIPDLVTNVLKSNFLDVLSVNENEAIIYASLLDKNLEEKKVQLPFEELALEAARILAKHVNARVDLHTTAFSATLKGTSEVVVPTFKIKPLRATGAGDAWTAGNIIGDHNNLSDQCRLMLANAVSACYLSDPDGKHPTWAKLLTVLKQHQ
jgi:ribokinase